MCACKVFLLLAAFVCGLTVVQAREAKILKVLPHYLDLEGRHSLSPSLYERDAYQDYLRKNPSQRSALRFDIHWKAKARKSFKLTLRLELLTSRNAFGTPIRLEAPVRRPRWFGAWSSLEIQGEEYRTLGDLMAWRATLWDGDQLLAEQKSFLW